MKQYFKVKFKTASGADSVFIETDSAHHALEIANKMLKEDGVNFSELSQERVEQSETPFSKSWLVEGMGTLKLLKAFENGQMVVKFEVDNPELAHIIEKPSFNLVIPDDLEPADAWNDFDLMNAIEMATGFYEGLSSKLFRAPLEDKEDIIH